MGILKTTTFAFITILISLILVVACSESKSDNSTLTVSTELIEMEADGGSAKFYITTDRSWTITCSDEQIWLSKTEGTGNSEIEVVLGARRTIQTDEMRLIVKTNDGSSICNILIKQSGILLSGTTLTVSNKGILFPFGGSAHELDSLMVLTNTPWQLYGPEWLEAYHDGRWVSLSKTRAMVSGDSQEGVGVVRIMLRTAEELDSDDDRADTLILKQSYEGSAGTKIAVTQLGRYSVDPNLLCGLNTSVACDWKTGTKVKEFYYKLSEFPFDENELNDLGIEKWPKSKPGLLNSWRNLKENTIYYLYTAGVGGSPVTHTRVTTLTTYSSNGQALAPISNVVNDGTMWHYDISLGDFCKAYVKLVTADESAFKSYDAALAWKINRSMHDDVGIKKYPLYTKSLHWRAETTAPIMIITWGLGNDGNNMSKVITRYITNKDSLATTREIINNNDEGLQFNVEPINLKEFIEKTYIIE